MIGRAYRQLRAGGGCYTKHDETKYRRVAMNTKYLLAFLAISFAATSSPALADAQAGAKVGRSVAGVWTVTATPRNCITGMPIPGAAFDGLFTFHKDGTLSVWVQNAAISLTRSPSHGLWQRDHGWSGYSYSFIHLRYDSSGLFAGKQVATGTLDLNEDGNGFTTDGTNTFFDAAGNPVGSGCATIAGTRFGL
jgi:hypothetical protein